MSQNKFEELQTFNQNWVKILIAILVGVNLYLPILTIFDGSYPTDIGGQFGIWFGLVISLGITWFLSIIKLHTKIYEDAICYRFAPFHFRYQQISWDEIEHIEIRKYNGLLEYGGWGLRYSMSGNGKCFTTRGNQGIQILLKNGKKIMIGTQKSAEVALILDSIKEKK